jgi:hypothetical protein
MRSFIMAMIQKQPRPTRVNVILRPKAQDIALEGATDGKFAVEDAKEIYDYMMLQSKKIKKPVKLYQPDANGKTPVVKFNTLRTNPVRLVSQNLSASMSSGYKVTRCIFKPSSETMPQYVSKTS